MEGSKFTPVNTPVRQGSETDSKTGTTTKLDPKKTITKGTAKDTMDNSIDDTMKGTKNPFEDDSEGESEGDSEDLSDEDDPESTPKPPTKKGSKAGPKMKPTSTKSTPKTNPAVSTKKTKNVATPAGQGNPAASTKKTKKAAARAAQNNQGQAPTTAPLEIDEILNRNSITVSEIKQALASRGLSTDGNRKDNSLRLITHDLGLVTGGDKTGFNARCKVLSESTMPYLKAHCTTLGLDMKGTNKVALMRRILQTEYPKTASSDEDEEGSEEDEAGPSSGRAGAATTGSDTTPDPDKQPSPLGKTGNDRKRKKPQDMTNGDELTKPTSTKRRKTTDTKTDGLDKGGKATRIEPKTRQTISDIKAKRHGNGNKATQQLPSDHKQQDPADSDADVSGLSSPPQLQDSSPDPPKLSAVAQGKKRKVDDDSDHEDVAQEKPKEKRPKHKVKANEQDEDAPQKSSPNTPTVKSPQTAETIAFDLTKGTIDTKLLFEETSPPRNVLDATCRVVAKCITQGDIATVANYREGLKKYQTYQKDPSSAAKKIRSKQWLEVQALWQDMEIRADAAANPEDDVASSSEDEELNVGNIGEKLAREEEENNVLKSLVCTNIQDTGLTFDTKVLFENETPYLEAIRSVVKILDGTGDVGDVETVRNCREGLKNFELAREGKGSIKIKGWKAWKATHDFWTKLEAKAEAKGKAHASHDDGADADKGICQTHGIKVRTKRHTTNTGDAEADALNEDLLNECCGAVIEMAAERQADSIEIQAYYDRVEMPESADFESRLESRQLREDEAARLDDIAARNIPMSHTTYYQLLWKVEDDEFLTKEEKENLRVQEWRMMEHMKVPVWSEEFREVRRSHNGRW